MPVFLVVLLLLRSPLAAQSPAPAVSVDLVGFVVDHETEKPIVGAVVEFEQVRRQVVTDTAGRFEVRGLPEGSYTIRTRRLGYVENRETSELRKGNFIVVSLLPQPLVLEGLTIIGDQFATRQKSSGYASVASGQEQLLSSAASSVVEYMDEQLRLELKECRDSAQGCLYARQQYYPVKATIFVDDAILAGGIEALRDLRPGDIYRLEVYPSLGQVRVYTPHYIEVLAKTGRTLPPLCIVCS